MSRLLDALKRAFYLIPPEPRACSVYVEGINLIMSGFLIRRWPKVVLLLVDGSRCEIELRRVGMICVAPKGYTIKTQETSECP